MLEELREIDTTALEKLDEIKKEQERLTLFRSKADAMKSSVDDSVFRKVLADYESREAALAKKAEPLKARALEEYKKLSSICERIEGIRAQARATKVELEFRHAVGEFDKNQLAEKLVEPEGVLEKCESQLEDADKLKTRFQAALHAVNELENTPQVGFDADAVEKFGETPKLEREHQGVPASPSDRSSGPESGVDAEARSEVQSSEQANVKIGVNPEANTRVEPDAEADLQARVISKNKPEAGSQAASGAAPDAEPEHQARVISKNKPRAGIDARSRIESKAKSQPKVSSEMDSKIGTNQWPEFKHQAPGPSSNAHDSGPTTDKTFIRPSSDMIEKSFADTQAKLVILSEGRPTDEFHLGLMNYIGRAVDNNIRIKSPAVSRKHALITADAANFMLKDLGSLSGTFVNAKKITECSLADGDKIKVGDVELVFRRL